MGRAQWGSHSHHIHQLRCLCNQASSPCPVASQGVWLEYLDLGLPVDQAMLGAGWRAGGKDCAGPASAPSPSAALHMLDSEHSRTKLRGETLLGGGNHPLSLVSFTGSFESLRSLRGENSVSGAASPQGQSNNSYVGVRLINA